MSLSLRKFMVLDVSPVRSNQKPEQNLTEANAWICIGTCVWKREDLDKARSFFKSGLEQLKLNRYVVDAWICLGTCVWKRGDVDKAKSCYKFGLEQDPKNKEKLRQLSVFERSQCIGETEVENPEEITGESIKHAKEAIALDVQDGISWYALGRVCLSAYYMTGTLDHNVLLQSTKAYKNAAKDQKMTRSAELWYNCSMAYKFLENYLMALAGLIMDPNLKSLEQTLNLCDVLDYINSLLQKLNDAKQLSSPTSSSLPTVDSLVSSLASVELDPSYERANVNCLTEGLNEGKAVTGKVVFSVKNLSKALSVQICASGFSATTWY